MNEINFLQGSEFEYVEDEGRVKIKIMDFDAFSRWTQLDQVSYRKLKFVTSSPP